MWFSLAILVFRNEMPPLRLGTTDPGESRRSSMEEIQKKTNFVFGRRSSLVPVTFERRSSLEAQAPAKSRRRRTHRKKPCEAPVPAPGLPRIQSEEYVP